MPTTAKVKNEAEALAYLKRVGRIPMKRVHNVIPSLIMQRLLANGDAIVHEEYLKIPTGPKQKTSFTFRGKAICVTVDPARAYKWRVLGSELEGEAKSPVEAMSAAEKAIMGAVNQRRTSNVNQRR